MLVHSGPSLGLHAYICSSESTDDDCFSRFYPHAHMEAKVRFCDVYSEAESQNTASNSQADVSGDSNPEDAEVEQLYGRCRDFITHELASCGCTFA